VALFLPPAVSVQRFRGGYKAVSDYTDLQDTETSDAQNVVYGPNGDIDQRFGSQKILNSRLANSATPTTGENITGHYFFRKSGASASFHVVCAGNSIYNYTSSTANAILTGLGSVSSTFYTFTQIQDPRSATDDVVIASNGLDPMVLWNGSGSAIYLSSVASSTGVPIAKYVISHKNRIYAANIIDSTNVDGNLKVAMSSFGTDAAPDPHRFLDSFFLGSGKGGGINGLRVLNDQIIIYTENSVWKFSPGSGNTIDTSTLIQMQESVGLFAPASLVDCGNFHIFLSERGIFAFDGNNFVHLSEKVDEELLDNPTKAQLANAKAVFNKRLNQYIIYFPSNSATHNNRGLVYDLRDGMKCWQPPITGRRVSYISNFEKSTGVETVIYGDYRGYLYEDDIGDNDGIVEGYNGTTTSATAFTLIDASASFLTTGDGLSGLMIRICEGTGAGQERVIESNTGTVITVTESWQVLPDTTSEYAIGGIDAYWRSKDYSFGNEDLAKIFTKIQLRVREEGNFSLNVYHIVDFNDLVNATLNEVTLLEDGFAWGLGVWGSVVWGGRTTIRRKVFFRSTNTQSTIGTHLALRFSNCHANEKFRISGFDVELKAIGKR